jgi:PRTRC genetic system protein C
MPIKVDSLIREFKFKKDGAKVTLPDPNPSFTVSEVVRFYSNQYPELTTAAVGAPKVEGDKAVYNFETTVGTNG